ncbi:hypothetical protein BC832DRAFT_562801 [Gaertneriomyces semiglobifer]|nr:hypothetical protein BC832DRAFT_562801 [Gaertneriomyces semiglobifer]
MEKNMSFPMTCAGMLARCGSTETVFGPFFVKGSMVVALTVRCLISDILWFSVIP